jgi:hypothetical protein
MIRTLNSIAVLTEGHKTKRVPLRYVYTALEDLYDLQRAGVLLVQRGYVELTDVGWGKVREESQRRQDKEMLRAYRTKVAQKVLAGMRALGSGWHSTAEVESAAGVCNKNARFWLSRLHMDGRVDRVHGWKIDPDRYHSATYAWRWRDV